MAIRAFDLSLDPSMCRLHIQDDSDVAHIPRTMFYFHLEKFYCFNFLVLVYDHQTVDTIDFRQNNTNLCLKFGQALKENELLLYILSDREPNSLELVVDQNTTLTNLWNLIKQELHMNSKKMGLIEYIKVLIFVIRQ